MSVQRDFFIGAGCGATSYPNFPFLQRYYLTGAGGTGVPSPVFLLSEETASSEFQRSQKEARLKLFFP